MYEQVLTLLISMMKVIRVADMLDLQHG